MLKEMVKRNRVLYKILYPIIYRLRYFIFADCRTIVFFVKNFFRRIGIIPYDKHLVRLENAYKNKKRRVFVVATGPSLTIEDLNWLEENNEVSISCNSIFRVYKKTKWRPTYYFVNDDLPIGYKTYSEEVKNFRYEDLAKEASFIPESLKRHLTYKINDNKLGFVPICYFDHWVKRPGRVCKYTSDLKNACYDLYTVTNSMIEFADYLGFEEIYLLGVDCNYYGGLTHIGENEKKDYSGMTKNEKDSYIGETERNYMIGFREAKRGIERNGKKVYNATRGGSLEVFERVNMDDIINGKIDK